MSQISLLFYHGYGQSLTGGSRTILNLLDRIDQNSFRPIFVSQFESPLTEQTRKRGVETLVVPFPEILDVYNEGIMSYTVIDKLRSARAVIDYNRRIEEIGRQYQVGGIWARNVKSVLLTCVAARRLSVPLIWDIGIEKKSRGLVRILHFLGLSLSKIVVTQAHSQSQNIFGSSIAKIFSSKFVTIYPGIEEGRIALLRQASNGKCVGQDQFQILNVGTIHPRKNQMMLLRAVRSLVKQHPHICVKFAGGVTDDAYLLHLKKFVRTEKLEPFVTFLGWYDDVPELMRQSDLFVLCSHDEGIPHVLREAMWAGIPVIATAVGGVPEMIENEKTGFLVAKDDAMQLQSVIEGCLTDPETRDRVSLQGREIVGKRFSITAWSSHYNDLLHQICKIDYQPR